MLSLKRIHWLLWLLPLFFVLHGIRENFGFIEPSAAFILLLTYGAYIILIWSICYWVLKNSLSSSWLTFTIFAYFLFFGAVKDFFLSTPSIAFLGKYSIFLSIGLIAIGALFYKFYQQPAKPSVFLQYIHTLLFVLVLMEVFQIVTLARKDKKGLDIYFSQKEMKFNRHCEPTKKPNIYFLLFDEYESSQSLKERYNFHNPLDSLLTTEKFHVIQDARSNYNFTPFSMASILNMDYLQGIPNPLSVTVEDYAKCNALIKNNRLIQFLSLQGYDIINYSIFDLAGHPSSIEQDFLPLQSKLISDRTLYAHVKKDIGWKLMEYFPFNLFFGSDYMLHHHNNHLFLQKVLEESALKKSKPLFLYAHFYMPHPPMYVDQWGKPRNFIADGRLPAPSIYLNYVLYTNQKIMPLVRGIKQHDPSGIIVIMGDHGYRNQKKETAHLFRALNAVYFPDGQYEGYDSSISHVNQFRVILNKIFCTQLPLLKDAQVLLKDKGASPEE